MKTEPAMIIAALTALLAVGIGFGLKITGEQKTLIMIAVAAIIPIVQGVITRYHVYTAAAVQTGLSDSSIKTVPQLDRELAKQN